jgi:hypothetical protein
MANNCFVLIDLQLLWRSTPFEPPEPRQSAPHENLHAMYYVASQV